MKPEKPTRRETTPCFQGTLADAVPAVRWSDRAFDAYDVANHYPDIGQIMMGLIELATKHCDWRYGLTQGHMMKMLGEAMQEAHEWLWWALEQGCPDNIEHDERVRIWATNILAKFYASVEHRQSAGSFAKALSGETGLTGKDSFKSRFEAERKQLRLQLDVLNQKVFAGFLHVVFQTAGFLSSWPSYKKRGRTLTKREKDWWLSIGQEPPSEIFDEQEFVAWEKQEDRNLGTTARLPILTTTEFAWAWDRNGKSMRQLNAMMKSLDARGFGNPHNVGPEYLKELRNTETLPLKWVANKNWELCREIYRNNGEKNPPKYLSQRGSKLKEAAKFRLVEGYRDDCDL